MDPFSKKFAAAVAKVFGRHRLEMGQSGTKILFGPWPLNQLTERLDYE
jgi:hypothetical protein